MSFAKRVGLQPRRPALPACDAVEYDSSTWLERAAALTSVVDSPKFTLCFWMYLPANSAYRNVLSGGGAGASFIVQTGVYAGADLLQFQVIGYKSGGALGVNLVAELPANSYTFPWACVMCSVGAQGSDGVSVAVNDTVITPSSLTHNSGDIDFTLTEWAIGGSYFFGSNPFNDAMAELLFWPGVFTDFSLASNRRLFVLGNGKPADPTVANGAIARLGTPAIYLHLDNGETANNFADNADGSGGAFSLCSGGALTTATTSPTD